MRPERGRWKPSVVSYRYLYRLFVVSLSNHRWKALKTLPFDWLSNCLECQALNAKWSCHRVGDLSIAFRMVSSFRIQAVSATFSRASGTASNRWAVGR